MAFWRDLFLPSSVTGPVLSCALRRLASICRSEVIELPVSNWVRFVILTAGRGIVRSESGAIHCPIKLLRAARGDPDFVCFLPERGSDAERLDPVAAPPTPFLAMPMQFAVMESAKGDAKFVAHLAAHRALLGKLDVMGVRRRATADQARLSGDEFEMLAVASTDR